MPKIRPKPAPIKIQGVVKGDFFLLDKVIYRRLEGNIQYGRYGEELNAMLMESGNLVGLDPLTEVVKVTPASTLYF